MGALGREDRRGKLHWPGPGEAFEAKVRVLIGYSKRWAIPSGIHRGRSLKGSGAQHPRPESLTLPPSLASILTLHGVTSCCSRTNPGFPESILAAPIGQVLPCAAPFHRIDSSQAVITADCLIGARFIFTQRSIWHLSAVIIVCSMHRSICWVGKP